MKLFSPFILRRFIPLQVFDTLDNIVRFNTTKISYLLIIELTTLGKFESQHFRQSFVNT
jgi:hypothetical protein